jgi:hypothetical protein
MRVQGEHQLEPFIVVDDRELSGVEYLNELLDNLRYEIAEYYGAIEEIKMGLIRQVPRKPDTLATFDQIREMNLQMIDGGLYDQPYIWLLEYAVCLQEQRVYQSQSSQQE